MGLVAQEELPLLLQQQVDGAGVQGVVDPVAVGGAAHQAAGHQLVHVVVDGVPGQAEADGQLLTVGAVVAQIAQDVEPGSVPQQVEGFVNVVPDGGLTAEHGQQLLPQNPAVDADAAVGAVGGQAGIHTEYKGPQQVLPPGGGNQMGGLRQITGASGGLDIPAQHAGQGSQGVPLPLQGLQNCRQRRSRFFDQLPAAAEDVQDGDL